MAMARPVSPEDEELDAAPLAEGDGAMGVLRAGVRATPELRRGLVVSVLLALVVASGRLVLPVAIQQILDRGVLGPEGFQAGFVWTASALAAGAIGGFALLNRLTYFRLMSTAEAVLFGLRTRAFAHVHRLSLAHHNESKRGILVARVTSDIETLAQFASWGAVSWVVNVTVIVVALAAMAVYAWQLAVVTALVLLPVVPVLKLVQRRQLAAYDALRSRVSDTLSDISEGVTGAQVVRAYHHTEAVRGRLHGSIRRQYRAQILARFYFAIMFPVSDVFGGLTLAAVVGVGAWWGPGWGLEVGSLIACVFLANLIVQPVAEIGEVLDQTQTALAGWRKVLRLLQVPVDVRDPEPGLELPRGALEVRLEGVGFEYQPGRLVLHDLDVVIPAGTNVAVVGETGSGKTTMAKLLCRLADPTSGRIVVGGLDLREVSADARHRAIRLVPQDGFLFDATVAENVRFGRPGASDDEVAAAFERLGLGWWVERLPEGLATEVGERGDRLSVGERQLVALARAQMSDPGLLVLDEATSAVDPETEQALAEALRHLTRGRTTVSVAHRLSTAEAAELVIVFDAGRVVEVGQHDELVAAGGTYAALYRSWLGNTRAA